MFCTANSKSEVKYTVLMYRCNDDLRKSFLLSTQKYTTHGSLYMIQLMTMMTMTMMMMMTMITKMTMMINSCTVLPP